MARITWEFIPDWIKQYPKTKSNEFVNMCLETYKDELVDGSDTPLILWDLILRLDESESKRVFFKQVFEKWSEGAQWALDKLYCYGQWELADQLKSSLGKQDADSESKISNIDTERLKLLSGVQNLTSFNPSALSLTNGLVLQ
jgi:hypothetical protein